MPRRLACSYFLTFFLNSLGVAVAEVDQSPLLDVVSVPAFENLVWPEWISGVESGKPIDPRPVVITGSGDGSNRLFVATQYGAIYWFENRANAEQLHLFLDIRERVMPFKPHENEEGLLGLAFHPEFKQNGEFFVCYSCAPTADFPHRSRISRFRVKPDDPNTANRDSEEVLLELAQPYWNHNGGTIVFGPDGYLYASFGDGGAANDPHMNGQNLKTLHSKILRIDVDKRQGGLAYGIPSDNPFVGQERYARSEIWAYGLRNVWRPTFDRESGALWAADLGQDEWEEINLIKPGGNYGWNLREGRHPFGAGGFSQTENLIEPIWEYDHSVGKSITGGYVYRGSRVPALVGAYLYADYVTGQIWALRYDAEQEKVVSNRSIRTSGSPVITFGEDDQGEVYFASEREIFTFRKAGQ